VSAVITRLVETFKHGNTLGRVMSESEWLERFNENALENKTVIDGLETSKRDAALEAWLRYRTYYDGYDFWLTAAEDANIEGEGSAKFADRKTVLANLARARDDAKAQWDGITNPVQPAVTSEANERSTWAHTEVSF
jgi:hypothetical protein